MCSIVLYFHEYVRILGGNLVHRLLHAGNFERVNFHMLANLLPEGLSKIPERCFFGRINMNRVAPAIDLLLMITW